MTYGHEWWTKIYKVFMMMPNYLAKFYSSLCSWLAWLSCHIWFLGHSSHNQMCFVEIKHFPNSIRHIPYLTRELLILHRWLMAIPPVWPCGYLPASTDSTMVTPTKGILLFHFVLKWIVVIDDWIARMTPMEQSDIKWVNSSLAASEKLLHNTGIYW